MFYSLQNMFEIELWFQKYYGIDNMYQRFINATSQFKSQLNSYTVNGFEEGAIAILFSFPEDQGRELIVCDNIGLLKEYITQYRFRIQPGYLHQIRSLSSNFEELKSLKLNVQQELCTQPLFWN